MSRMRLLSSFIESGFRSSLQKRSQSTKKYSLDIENMNANVKIMEYAVRGPILIRAAQIIKELAAGAKKPFTEVITVNVGDCHAMGQSPITYIRQLMSTVVNPVLIDHPCTPCDVREKARQLLEACGGSVGCMSDPAGIELIRRRVAKFIENRDGYPCCWENIILSAGASEGIKSILKMFINTIDCKPTGVMISIPQYPLYSATLAEFGLTQVGYYLNEETEWALVVEELDRAYEEYADKCSIRAIVVINPGNPTGQVLTEKNIREIIEFAHRRKLFILADEVYQYNVYAEGSKFHSFKKVMMNMGEPYCSMELASFVSCSKGYMGECGLRGGFIELFNMHPEVYCQYLKYIENLVCPNISGQICLDAVVNPPVEGDDSYELFEKEKMAILDSLKLRAQMVVDAFNSFEGFSCNPVQGALYAFAKISLPPKAIEEAAKRNQKPDVFYAFELLENVGVCVVPGSGFGQQPGTFHFRTTILPQVEKLKQMLEMFRSFHVHFEEQYK